MIRKLLRKRLAIIKNGVLFLCTLIGYFAKKQESVTILFYHSIDNSGSTLSLSIDEFKQQINHLIQNNHHCLRLSDVISYINGKREVPRNSFCITFDDGYSNSYASYLYLVERGLPFTIFIATDTVEKDSQIITTTVPEGLDSILTWEKLLALAKTGLVDIEAHGHTHQNFTDLDVADLERELNLPRCIILERLGKKSRYLAYPRGAYDKAIKDMVKEAGYEAALGIEPGVVKRNDDLWSIKRIGINDRVTWLQFRLSLSPAYEFYLWFQRILYKGKQCEY